MTGRTGVLGKSFVESISSVGGKVVILDRKAEIATTRAQEINLGREDALAVEADVLEEKSLIKAKDLII